MAHSYPLAGLLENNGWTTDDTVVLPSENREGVASDAVLDAGYSCPVCGKPYELGDPALALTSVWLGCGETHRRTADLDGYGHSELILGHHGCVLPRLLTLVASLHPVPKFIDDGLMPG